MRWSILLLMSLSLACSKKEPAAPTEPEQAAETEAPSDSEGFSPELGAPTEPSADVPRPKGAEELPPPLRTPAPPLSKPPVIEVLDQGEEPRRALGWKIKPGFEQKLSADIGFSIEAIVVVLRTREGAYTLTYDLNVRAEKVGADGSVRVAYEVDDANVNLKRVGEQRLERMKLAVTTARQIRGGYTLGPRGRITDFEMKIPDGMTRTGHDMADNLRWALFQMTPIFPEQAVGEGAKWTVHQGVLQRGIRVNQLTTFKVVKLEGERVELTMEQLQSAAKQAFRDPGLPVTKQLTLLSATANGPLKWDLTELAPRAADLGSGVLKAAEQPSTDPKHRPLEVLIQSNRALQITEK